MASPCPRVAAKPSRPALRSAKASGCPAAAVASSAAGGAPLRASPKALRALEEALGLRSTKALRRRGPGGRLIAAPTVGTGVWWRCRGRCLHRPEPAAGGSHCRRRGLVLPPAGHFSPRKSAENAPGAAAPGLPLGLRGVHPRERHLISRYAPPGRPVSYCLPLPGFARASRIGWLLRLQRFSLRPLQLPRNTARHRTQQFLHEFSRCT